MTGTEIVQTEIAQAGRILQIASKVLVLTGAGISAESGVPTFRGPGGYWRNRHFSELANPQAFARDPALVWEWYCERRRTVVGCEPNAAHHALARFASSRTGVTLVTQNVDGLHERAGHPDAIRLHGSLWKNRCTECGVERDADDLRYPQLPRSPCCDAVERPAIVWFGEEIPLEPIRRSVHAVVCAQAVLVIGTTGSVYPAAGFVKDAKQRGAVIIDVNPDASAFPHDIAIRLPAGQSVPSILL